jgi:hypothetical protein
MTFTNIPHDTRLVEFLSAAAFLIGAVALFAHPEEYFADVRLTYIKALFMTIGTLQMIPIFLGRGGMLFKTVMCLAAGSVWLWGSFASLPRIGAYPMFTIGIVCLYAFIINSILMKKAWQ